MFRNGKKLNLQLADLKTNPRYYKNGVDLRYPDFGLFVYRVDEKSDEFKELCFTIFYLKKGLVEYDKTVSTHVECLKYGSWQQTRGPLEFERKLSGIIRSTFYMSKNS